MRINEMAQKAYQTAEEHGFHPKNRKLTHERISSRLALIHSEISEALEVVREKRKKRFGNPLETYFPWCNGKPEGFVIELADAMIRIGDLAQECDVNLEKAVKVKMEYNKTRPRKHGRVI